MDIDLIFLGAFLALFSFFTAVFLIQRLCGQRKSDDDRKRRTFYPSTAALSLALLSLQTLAQPDLYHSLEQRLSEADDSQEDGDPDDPSAQLNRQLRCIRNNEPVDNLQVPYFQSDKPINPENTSKIVCQAQNPPNQH